ncbi:BREX-1 system adenine-specific DNA-methyltransferase PglX [Psychrobacillus sp. PGGUH221]|uniref:BREX-1 system adenine-specific DNA-methyltransferase PglX n=1 Tax=Psychrobacillus sp. PGGUH221 TaxID=3020058 RepID=UPI0035C75DD0
MNKTALKNFATNARRELLERVELQARKIGITAESIQKANVESSDAVFIDGKQLLDTESRQRNKLIARINEIGFDRVMEETAYTWFNRFVALRFMEVNDYLPTKVRVLSSINSDSAEPDMMKEALSLNLDLDKEYVYDLKMNNKTNELFKYLIKMHCNDLNRYMPFMFETIEDYTEILFPEGLLGTDSFIRKMTDIEFIPEDNWVKVEVIGWLYQYYISEEKDAVFANLKKNIKITKETLPAATQLFTPNWIVRYMVENSLGRTWLESYPESQLKPEWKYYLDEAGQEEVVIKQLEEIRHKNVNPEDILFLDPCCGSGHILVYAFEVFYDIYIEKGYMENEIPQLILEKNLYGLDVDNRAVQLASFAVMMKAREKSRRVFANNIKLNIKSIQESNWITDETMNYINRKLGDSFEGKNIFDSIVNIRNTFLNAKEFGSILSIDEQNLESIQKWLLELNDTDVNLVEMIQNELILENMPSLILQTRILSQKYDVVCTNPPYMGNNGMNTDLSNFLKNNYSETKSDLSTVFMEKARQLTKQNGFYSMINIPVWMFSSSFEKLRLTLLNKVTFTNVLHLGRGVFGSDFGTVAFVIKNNNMPKYIAIYKKLFKKQGAVDSLEKKEEWFFQQEGTFEISKEKFINLPSTPIAYWISDNIIELFKKSHKLGEVAEPKAGLATGDNNIFQRVWYELNVKKIGFNYSSTVETEKGQHKWFPCNSGGSFRKWYGNNEMVVDWQFDGERIRNFRTPDGKLRSRPQNTQYFFKEGLTWTKISSGKFGVRYKGIGFIFDDTGRSAFTEDLEENFLVIGLLCSKVAFEILSILNPSMSFTNGDIYRIPYVRNISPNKKIEIIEKVKENIGISKNDWDSYETSWDFEQHPLLTHRKDNNKVKESFEKWQQYNEFQFRNLKENEEELNRIFIELNNLENEISYQIEEKDVTIRRADLEIDIKSFISYAMGCSFGRYSLDEEGLIYAGGEFNSSSYRTFLVNQDNILPIMSSAYFEDDIVTRFVDFVRVTFGEETLEENLVYVANAIGQKKNETAREVLRRYFLNDFYKDHIQVYKKRPIFWLFTSGKEKAFNCLIYMHRYDKTTLSRIRTDYLHEVQVRMDAEKKDLLNIIEGDSTTKEISDAKKELKSLDKKIDELKAYDELLHHMADMQIEIDLDDGVVVNYEKFNGLVAKI